MKNNILLLILFTVCSFTGVRANDNASVCLLILESKLDITCYGANNGYIRVNDAGCKGKVTYSWSNGKKTREIKNLKPGYYTVTMEDENKQVRVNTWQIFEPEELTLTESILHPLCYGDKNGQIYLSTDGGTAPFTFDWSNGSTMQNIRDLKSGTYTVTVTDDNKCTAKGTYKVVDPPKVTLTTEYKYDVSCYGKNDGTIKITPKGGTPPHTVKWSNGSTSTTIKNLKPGSYTVTIYDVFLCEGTNIFTISEPKLLEISTISQSNITCNGDNNGSLEVEGSGGSGGYLYDWSTGDTSPKISALKPGKYNVTVTDKNKCVTTASYTITEPNKLTVDEKELDNNLCYGDAEGRIVLSVNGGTSPYSYDWSNGDKTSEIKDLKAGTYTVTVTDKNKCTVEETFKISEPNELAIDLISKKNNLCFGDKTGSIEIKGDGGTPPYSYDWDNGETSASITDLIAGKYTVIVTDANKCTSEETFEVDQPKALEIALITKKDVICFGEAGGSLAVEGKEGTPPYTYGWSNGETTPLIEDLKAGSYEVVITDANKCEITKEFEIDTPDELILSLERITHNTCGATKEGSIEVAITGGTGKYTYLWSNGETTASIDLLEEGSYTVEVFDENKCQIEETFEIKTTVDLLPSKELVSDVRCNGEDNGYVILEMKGGKAPYTFNWSTGSTSSTISKLGAGKYTCTVKDAEGCTFEGEYTIIDPAAITFEYVEVDHALCAGDSNAMVAIGIEGGTGETSVEWTYTPTGEDNPKFVEWTYRTRHDTIDSLGSGILKMQLKDENGCGIIDSVEIQEPDPIIRSSAVANDVLCHADSTGKIHVQFEGGVSLYEVEWTYSPDPKDNPRFVKWTYNTPGDTLSQIEAGTYYAQVKDTNDCVFNDTFEIMQPTRIGTRDVVTQDLTCHKDSSGRILLGFDGGISPYAVKWTYRPKGGKTAEEIQWADNVLSDTLKATQAGIIGVEITDKNKCIVLDSFEIEEPKAIKTIKGNVEDPACYDEKNGSIKVGFDGDFDIRAIKWTYRPVNGKSFEEIKVTYDENEDLLTNAGAGTYRTEVTDIRYCEHLDSFEVNQADEIGYKVVNVKSSSGNTGAIDLDTYGGTGARYFAWEGPKGFTSTDEDIDQLEAGEYVCQISDDNKCFLFTDTIVVQITTSTKSVEESGVNIYPMPFQDLLTIKFDRTDAQDKEIRLYTSSGQLVISKEIFGSNINLDTKSLSAQSYILMIYDGSDWIQSRVIKQ